MHVSAITNYEKFLQKYFGDAFSREVKVLDVGSLDVNGSLKPSTLKFLANAKYTGLDQEKGNNVDVVGTSHKMPFKKQEFDLIISSSCFEHDELFWVTFKEMTRVAKKGALIYINAPSAGPYHGYPGDCWRFYADSWKGLAKWCPELELLESYVDNEEPWKDSVGIFKKK